MLSDKEVLARAETTVKMANVAGTSAEQVSDQLTAVWNNFYDGSKSLEYYADVMVRLGADTASSTDEISEGLNKFAAVADSVGLSYEYAASALATVTATTRQSADVVGNAYKTLFSRIQGLNLGETQDDGTTLNKYSEALDKVGINIKDTNGEIKDMDIILDELGNKWKSLGKDTQLALAQTVGGARQYTQLIALMDNWDYFQQNLTSATMATGSLDAQAEIYAESWEAASTRVRAAWENIYQSIIDDGFFIDLQNMLADVLNGFAQLTDGMGGFKGLLLTIGPILAKVFQNQILSSIGDLSYNLTMMTKKGQDAVKNQRNEANYLLQNMSNDGSIEGSAIADSYAAQAQAQQTLIDNSERMSEEQRRIASIYLDQQESLAQQVRLMADASKLAEQESKNLGKKVVEDSGAKGEDKTSLKEQVEAYQNRVSGQAAVNKVAKDISDLSFNEDGSNFDETKRQLQNLLQTINQIDGAIENYNTEFPIAVQMFKDLENALNFDPKSLGLDNINLDDLDLKNLGLGDLNFEGLDEERKKALIEEKLKEKKIKETLENFKASSGIFENTPYAEEQEQQLTDSLTQRYSEQLRSEKAGRLEAANTDIADASVQVNEAEEKVAQAQQAVDETKQKADELEKRIKNLKEQVNTAKADAEGNKSEETKAKLESLQKELKDSSDELKEVNKDLKATTSTLDKANDKLDDSRDKLDKAQKKRRDMDNDIDEQARSRAKADVDKIKEGSVKEGEGKVILGENVSALQQYTNAINEELNKMTNTQKVSMAFMNIANSITSTLGILNTFRGLISTLNDEDLSFGEKLTAVFSTIAMTVPNVISLMDRENQQTLQWIGNKVMEISTRKASAAAAKEEAEAKEDVVEKNLVEAGSSSPVVAGKVAEAGASKVAKEVTEGETKAKGLNTIKTWLQVAANKALALSQTPIAIGIAAIVASFIALAAVVGVVAWAFTAISNEMNKEAIAAEKASQAAQALAEDYKNCKQEYDDMIAAHDKYTSAVDALSKMQAGTDEYKKSLQEANEAAKDLIESYGLTKDDYSWENGLLKVNEDAIKEKQTEQEARVNTAYGAAQMSQSYANEAKTRADIEKLRNEASSIAAAETLKLVYADAGATLATAIPLAATGNVPGAAVAASVGAVGMIGSVGYGALNGEKFNRIAEGVQEGKYLEGEFAEYLDRDFQELFANEAFGQSYEELDNAARQLINELIKLNTNVSLNNDAQKLSAEMAAQNVINNNELIKQQGKTGELVEIGGQIYQQAYDDLAEKYEGNELALLDDYEAAAGLTELRGYRREDNRFNKDGTLEYSYLDDNGERQTAELLRDEVLNFMAAQEAAAKLETSLPELLSLQRELSLNESDNISQALAKIISEGDLSNATQNEVNAFADKEGNVTEESVRNAIQQVDGLQESIAQAGIPMDKFVKTVTTSVAEASQTLAELSAGAADSVQQVVGSLNEEITNNLTGSQKQNVANAMQDIYSSAGREGIEELAEVMNSLEPEEAAQFAEALGEIDWNTASPEEVIARLTEMGVVLDENAKDAIPKLIAALKDMKEVTLDVAQTQYNAAQKVKDQIGEDEYARINSTDYQELSTAAEQYGINMSNYFTELADGTFMLTAKASEVKDIIDSISLAPFFQMQADLAHEYELLQPIVEKGLSTEDLYKAENQDMALNALEASGWGAEGEMTALRDSSNWESQEAQTEAVKAALDEAAITAEGIKQDFSEIPAEVEKINAMIGQAMFESKAEDAGVDANEAADYAEHIMEIAESSDYFDDSLASNEEAAGDLAIEILRLNKGIETLGENFDEWGSILKSSSKESQEYAKAMSGTKKALADVLDIEEDLISNDFVEEHLGEIKKAAQGDADSIDELRSSLDEMVMSEVMSDDHKIKMGVTVSNEELSRLDSEVQLAAANIDPNIDVGVTLQDEAFLEAANNLVQQAGMTADQANAYFAGIGYEPMYDTEDIDMSTTVPQSATEFIPYENGRIESLMQIGPLDVPISIPNISYKQSAEALSGVESPGKQTLVAFSGGDTPPQIKGLRKKATGAANNFSSSNKGGSKPSGGGGGGNKSSSTSKLKNRKKASDEIERYHEIKETLDDIQQSYSRINDARERAYGPDKIGLMDQELEKQKQLADAQLQYLNEIEVYLAADKKALEEYGAVIDSVTGQILNYDEIMNAQLAKFNSLLTEEAEEEYNAFKKVLEQYEETNNLLQEQQDELTQIQNQIYDLKLEKIQLNLELNTEIQDDSLEYLEYLLDNLTDDAADAADALALLAKSTEANLNKIAATEEAIDSIMRNHGIKDLNAYTDLNQLRDLNFTEDEINTLRDYRSELLSANQELVSLREEAVEKVTSAFDAWNDELDLNLEKFDHYNEVLDTFKNIIDIIGKDALKVNAELLQGLSDATVDNSINKLEASRIKMEELRRAEAEARAELQNASTQEEIKIWEETLTHIEEQTNEAEEEMLSNWNDALDAAAEAFESTVERVIASYESAMSGVFGSFDGLQQAYDQQAEIADRYVADYKEIYELNKLNRDISKSIDDNDSIKAKQLLRDLQEEINDLQENEVEMSQYDLDFLRKKYELRLAEIALEEAQDAKSQVRMKRDSEGNYSYVFTADQSQIDAATQRYEDQLYAMQELNSQYIQEMQNNILQSEIELANALRELDKTKYASDEEYYKAVSDLTAYYGGQRDYYLDEMEKGLTNNQETYSQDWANYSALTGYKMSADSEYLDKFSETQLAQINGYKSIEDAQNQYKEATKIMVNDLHNAFKNWQEDMEQAMVAAGTSVEQFGNTMADSVYGDGSDENPGIAKASDDAVEQIRTLANEMGLMFSDQTLDSLASWAENYAKTIAPILDENQKLVDSINAVIAAEAGLTGSRVTATISTSSSSGSNLTRFDTGGYTGNWSDNYGRLALLDKKELILKENDTANMLKSLEVLHAITRVIDLNAGAQSAGLGNLVSSTIGETSQVIEQHVEIQAEFPNATDRNEIQEAFGSLLVQASQFANRKNK